MHTKRDLTQGSIPRGLLGFALPLILGNLLQQLYNLADTWVVGQFIGEGALAAVGSSYTLMTFLTSILLGLCMGSSVYFSIQFGRQDPDKLRSGIFQAFLLIGAITLVLNALVYALVDPILLLLQIPPEVTGLTKTYLLWVFAGIVATFLYNFFANLLRAVGNSVTPLLFLGISVVLNIGLDLLFVVPLQMGVQGAALATVISQYLAGLGLAGYTWKAFPALRVRREDRVWNKATLRQLLSLSGFTCLQQSVMNFGILMVQGLVNSFGTTVMAAFAVAVKIDTLAYMPVQDFGNAFSTFIAQNYGAGRQPRTSGPKSGPGSAAAPGGRCSGWWCSAWFWGAWYTCWPPNSWRCSWGQRRWTSSPWAPGTCASRGPSTWALASSSCSMGTSGR